MDVQHIDGIDKAEHAAVGAVVGWASSAAVNRWLPSAPPAVRVLVPASIVCGVSLGKEEYDRRHPRNHTNDPRDAAAGIVGGFVAVGLTLKF